MPGNYIREIFNQFKTSGSWESSAEFGSGHIHKTWLIRTAEEDQPDYILQKINHNVFPPVAEMMENIRKVTGHIIEKIRPGTNRTVLEIIETTRGSTFYNDTLGDYWRMYYRIEPGISYDTVPNNKVAGEAGKAFGQFIGDLRDMPVDEIFPVIPGFNSMELRYNQFINALEQDPLNRAAEVKKEIDYVYDRIENMMTICLLEKEGKIPVRITHNDTKLNNVLFSNDDKAVAVIDLDTVMPGLVLYDFGDTIRTAASTGAEDEADLSAISFSIEVLKAYSEGFLEKTAPFLNRAEIEYLALSAQYMTFIMGLRFLTDYIAGDVYYLIKYPDQNLRRCRAQFRLMECMRDKYNETYDIITKNAEIFSKH